MNTENIEEALWIILNARQCRNGLEKETKSKNIKKCLYLESLFIDKIMF
ncbi:hypothetical protein KLPMMM115B_08100 [Klebsiella pneumoniae]|nr:Uncharacterised protein [Klebsiella pneumoniae]